MSYKILEWIDARTDSGAFSEPYDQLNAKGQAACDTRLLYLRDQQPHMWRDPSAKKLDWSKDCDCKDIYEIRFLANNVPQRPMGYFGPNKNEFTIVIWVTHKGKQYTPKEFCAIAKKRWAEVRNGNAITREVEID
ncbi:hypothetical protein [Vogesella sp. XCS3]|uniref:hypothetical protein n=1 Tax=Vogesella sp. XCS3 TaxID=2877939 RepID=UPI001D09C4A9|nr:hypothetical protein [Vogesella sp. XCS3]UDM18819.1 hypothetical protein LCH97_04320 [Vogesella sp. XCS3]